MEPKWSPKEASGYFLGSEKTMVFTAREAYEGVSGRLWEAIFSRLRLQTLSGGVPGSILADFGPFGGQRVPGRKTNAKKCKTGAWI